MCNVYKLQNIELYSEKIKQQFYIISISKSIISISNGKTTAEQIAQKILKYSVSHKQPTYLEITQ